MKVTLEAAGFQILLAQEDRHPGRGEPGLPLTYLFTWPMAKRLKFFGDYIFSRENKPFKLLFQGPGRLSELNK